MKYISVIGSCNMDMIVESDIRPKAGETVMGNDLYYHPAEKEQIRQWRRRKSAVMSI